MKLARFIRLYNIQMECAPVSTSPHARGNYYYHQCKLLRYDGERWHKMHASYWTADTSSVQVTRRRGVERLTSRVSKIDIIYNLAVTAAIFELAKRDKRAWASYYDFDSPDLVEAKYNAAYEQSWALYRFLVGQEAGERTGLNAYHSLISDVDEVRETVLELIGG